MKAFRYRALDARGELHEGELSAASQAELEQQLAADGLSLIRASGRGWWQALRPRPAALSRAALIHFCFQLEQLLDAGVPPLESLRSLAQPPAEAAAAALADSLRRELERGLPLSAAAARQPQLFRPGLLALLRAGEESGRLSEALHELGASLEQEQSLARHLQRLLLYPLILLGVLLLTLIVALTVLVPELEKLFLDNALALPWQTRSLIALSDFTLAHGLKLALLLGAAGLALLLAVQHWPPARRHGERLLLRLPLLGPLLAKISLATIATMLARLYSAGINLLDALPLAAAGSRSQILQEAMLSARERIRQGQSLSSAFAAEALFPPLVDSMLKVGEHSGRLDEALDKLATLYARDIAHASARLQALLEPALTVLLGLILLWLASAVLGPVYGLITELPL